MKSNSTNKDSLKNWLDCIPEQWKTVKLKKVTQFLYGNSLSNENRLSGNIPVYGSNGIIGYHNKAITKSPCIIIGRKGSQGKVNLSKVECYPIDTTFYIDTTVTHNELRWLYYLLKILKLDAFSKESAVPGLNRGDAYDKIVPLPSIPIQKMIANYLDRKTQQINTLIERNQKQIELLKELRTGVINQAVTKGLNLDVKMKDSGIEWLGDIPEHWEVKKLKYVSNIKTGEKDTIDREDNGIYPFFVRSDKVEKINSYSFNGEAVLTAGDGVGVGRVFHYINGRFDFHQRVYKISDFKEVLGKYFFYYLKHNFHKEVIKISAKSTVDSLRLPMFLDFPVAFGDSKEQEDIIQYIEINCQKIDLIILKTKNYIELLKEYRTSLISEVVTGKIDVRNEI